MDASIDVNAEINSLKQEIADLKRQLETATGDEKRRLEERIIACQNSLTAWINRLPPASSAGIFLEIFVYFSDISCVI